MFLDAFLAHALSCITDNPLVMQLKRGIVLKVGLESLP